MPAPLQDTLHVNMTGLSPSSAANYEARLNKLIEITNQTLKHILTHPRETYPKIMQHTSGRCTTASNFVTAICKVFSSNPDIAERYARSYKKWKSYLYECKNKIHEEYSENQGPQHKLDQVVTMDEIRTKYQALKEGTLTPQTAQHLVLLSCFMNLAPKRADLGNVRLFDTARDIPTDASAINYIYLARDPAYKVKPFLQLNKFKTAKHMPGGIRENINDALLKDLHASLLAHPRQFLFVDRSGRPYTKNNSYSQYVKRTFEALFGPGKGMGVSLWRHVWVSTEMDMHKMREKDILDRVNKMGTSERQLKHVYKWVNMDQDKKQVCETICKPVTP